MGEAPVELVSPLSPPAELELLIVAMDCDDPLEVLLLSLPLSLAEELNELEETELTEAVDPEIAELVSVEVDNEPCGELDDETEAALEADAGLATDKELLLLELKPEEPIDALSVAADVGEIPLDTPADALPTFEGEYDAELREPLLDDMLPMVTEAPDTETSLVEVEESEELEPEPGKFDPVDPRPPGEVVAAEMEGVGLALLGMIRVADASTGLEDEELSVTDRGATVVEVAAPWLV